MDIWHWLISHKADILAILGPVVFPAALLIIILPVLITRTPHARSESPPVPAFPMFPWQHFRLWNYAFSNEAWQAGKSPQRIMLLLFRVALVFGCSAVLLIFAIEVASQLQPAI